MHIKQRDERFDIAWMNTVLAVIGDILPDSEEICGVTIGPKQKAGKLSLWTKNATKKDAVLRIGEAFKKVNDYVDTIEYQAHADSLRTERSRGAASFRI